MFRKTFTAATAALVIAAAASAPAEAGPRRGAILFGIGAVTALSLMAAANASHAYGYGDEGYADDGYGSCRRIAHRCASRFGRHNWRFERCMDRRGC